MSRRSIGSALAALALIALFAPGALAAAEDSVLAKINAERTGRGLPALGSHWDLVDDAEAHSHRMMDGDNLHHNPNLGSVTTDWLALGENVGVGPSVDSIHNAFMNSSPHRANILGDYTHVGVGAVRESESRLWVTVVFMKAADSSPPTTTTTTPPPAVTLAPQQPAPPAATLAPVPPAGRASPPAVSAAVPDALSRVPLVVLRFFPRVL